MVPGLIGLGGMGTLNVVFWDVDGTLADTEMDGHRPAFNLAFRELGLPLQWNPEEYARRLEIPGGLRRVRRACEDIGLAISDDQLQQLREVKRRHYTAMVNAGNVGWRPGVIRLLNALLQEGIQNWIVTSSGRASVEALLNADNGTIPAFDGVVTADDVVQGKPDPELYQLAMMRAGVKAENALAIEDSLAGLQSARAAGLGCVLTPSPWETELASHFNDAVSVVNQLGEPGDPSTVIHGPACEDGLVTVKYLKVLLSRETR